MRKVFFLFLSAIFLLSVPLGTEIQAAGTIDNYSMWAVEEENDQYTLDIFALSGIAPWDQFTTVSGPNNYDQQNWDYWEYIVRYNYKEGMYYEVERWTSDPPSDGDYTLELLQGPAGNSLDTTTVTDFTKNMLPVVDISTATPVDGSYLESTTPTFTWTGVTDETATLYYRIYVQDPFDDYAIVAYISDRSVVTSETISIPSLEPNRAYKWRVEAFDAPTADAQNVSRSDWSHFFTGSDDPATVALSVDKAFVRSRIKTNNRSYTEINISITGPAPEDTEIQVIGPLGATQKTYDIDWADYYGDSYGMQLKEQLEDGTYQFTVTDKRHGGVPITVTRTLQANWTQPIHEEDDFNLDDGSYLDTDTPTFTWTPLGEFSYQAKIFTADWAQTLYTSGIITQTQITIPENILQKDVAYILRVENYDSHGNRGSSSAPAFFIANDNEPASISGEILAGSSGAGGPIFVVVTDNQVLAAGEEYGFALLSSPGTYTIYNVPRKKDLYVHAIFDHDTSDSYSVGDFRGSYISPPDTLPTAINLPITGGVLTGYNVTLDTEVLATNVTGTVTCNNYSTGTIYVGAFEKSHHDTPLKEVALPTGPGSYTIPDLPVGGRFYIKAWWDSDGSGTGGPTTLDQLGENPSNPIIVGSSGNSGIDINIETTGFIAGHVFEDDGVTPIADLAVQVQNTVSNEWFDTRTDSNGLYAFQLPDGSHYNVITQPGWDDLPFAQQWQDSITVTNPDVTAVDFTLSISGIISGYVYESDGTTPIVDLHVSAQDSTTREWMGGDNTNNLGFYSITVPTGTYDVNTCSNCGDTSLPFVNQTKNSISVTAPDTTTVNFSLSTGGAISGYVYESDGTPIVDLRVYAEDSTTGQWMGGDNTNNLGFYSITVPTGTYDVNTCSNCGDTSLPFVNETKNSISVSDPNVATVDFTLSSGGTISGTVYEDDGVTPIQNFRIEANLWATGNYAGGTSTDELGNYTLRLDPGNYKVRTCATCEDSPYVDEYYNNSDWNNAAKVEVNLDTDTPDIDFQLSSGGSISGTVFEDDGVTPIQNLRIEAQDSTTGNNAGGTYTDASGDYTLYLNPGSFKVSTCASCDNFPYVDEHYDDSNWDNAAEVEVTLGNDTPNIDFELISGGTISGTVVESDGTTPIDGMWVRAVELSTGNQVSGASTNSNGDFTINIAPGTYKVQTCSSCNNHPYLDEYFDNTDQDHATEIIVRDGLDTPNIDFELARGGIISGYVYESDETTPINNIHVYADNSTTGQGVGGNNTNNLGFYSFAVPTGTYNVTACPNCSDTPLPFTRETKNSISVTAPNETRVNFSLTTGGSISGTVYDATTPLLPNDMYISAFSGDPCGHNQYLGRGEINSTTGEYTIEGLPAGDIYIQTDTGCNFYKHQTYDENPSTTGDCDQLDPVGLSEGENVGGKDFHLEKGGMITGTVTQSDGSTPLINVHMMAFNSSNGQFMAGNNTDDSGDYCLIVDTAAAPTGSNFKVESCASCSNSMPYIDKYYNNQYSWDTADSINVSLYNETPDIDFSLNDIIPGDIDGDEDVDLADLIKGLQIMAGSFPAGTIFTTGDTNGDNRIGMEDLLYIIGQL